VKTSFDGFAKMGEDFGQIAYGEGQIRFVIEASRFQGFTGYSEISYPGFVGLLITAGFPAVKDAIKFLLLKQFGKDGSNISVLNLNNGAEIFHGLTQGGERGPEKAATKFSRASLTC
jgi:hypothetical protein